MNTILTWLSLMYTAHPRLQAGKGLIQHLSDWNKNNADLRVPLPSMWP